MEKKEKQRGAKRLLGLLICIFLACAGLVFVIYTLKELCWLKTQIREHEKLLQTLQLGEIQVRESFSYLHAVIDSEKRFGHWYRRGSECSLKK